MNTSYTHSYPMLTCWVDNSIYLQPGATITYTDGEGNGFCLFFTVFATDPLENLFLGKYMVYILF